MSLIDDFYLTSDRFDATDYVPILGHAQHARRVPADPFPYPAGFARSQEIAHAHERRSRAQ